MSTRDNFNKYGHLVVKKWVLTHRYNSAWSSLTPKELGEVTLHPHTKQPRYESYTKLPEMAELKAAAELMRKIRDGELT